MRPAVLALPLVLAGCGTTQTRTVTVTMPAHTTASHPACVTVEATGQRLCDAEGRGFCEGTRAALAALSRYADPRADPRATRERGLAACASGSI